MSSASSHFVTRVGRLVLSLPEMLIVGMIRAYQLFIRPLIGPRCRFHPSCSEYFILAVRKYGVLSGSARGVWRILRCHPFHPGGYDPP